jgi:hypothetical protein
MKKQILKQFLVLTMMILSTVFTVAQADPPTKGAWERDPYKDLTYLRVFSQMPRAEMASLFSRPDAIGVRKVYNMAKVKVYVDAFVAKASQDEDWADVYAGEDKAAFELENISDRHNNPQDQVTYSIDMYAASARYMEADDRNPPRATFLKIAGQWYLLPARYGCDRFGVSHVSASWDEASVLSVNALRGSGGMTQFGICEVKFKFAGQNTVPVISEFTTWSAQN